MSKKQFNANATQWLIMNCKILAIFSTRKYQTKAPIASLFKPFSLFSSQNFKSKGTMIQILQSKPMIAEYTKRKKILNISSNRTMLKRSHGPHNY